MRKILILGGTGFIGQYLINDLLKDSDNIIICISRRKDFLKLLHNSRILYIQSDYSKDHLSQIIRENEIDSVIHLGSSIPSNYQEEISFEEECISGIDMANEIFNICKNSSIYNVVFASSIAVYGDKKIKDEKNFEENNVLEPVSIYGVAKASIELIAGYYNTHYGMHIKSLRIGQVFGARRSVKNQFLKMLEDKCNKKEPITIYGKGITSQDYVYIKDVTQGIIKAIIHENVGGVFNIGIGRQVSIRELAESYCIGFENNAGIELLSNKKETIHFNGMDITKAKNILGYFPQYSLVTACKEMAKLYSEGNVFI